MFEPRRQFLFLTINDASATCAVVIFTSVDSSGHWTDWSIKSLAMLLFVCQFSRDDIGYEDSRI